MTDVLRALAISASILLPVVGFILIISIVTVKRGEASMRHAVAGLPDALAAVAGKAVKAVSSPADETFVLTVLLVGSVVFAATVGLLLGLSVLQHM